MSQAILIAIASRDGKTVAGHIGKCKDWILFEATPATEDKPASTSELERINLPKHLVFHHYKDDQPHPLTECAAVIGASAGESFVKKMAKRGVDAVLTAEESPQAAALAYVENNVLPPKPRPIGELVCKMRDALSSS